MPGVRLSVVAFASVEIRLRSVATTAISVVALRLSCDIVHGQCQYCYAASNLRFGGGGWRLVAVSMSTTAIFGVVFLGFIVTKTDYPRSITLGAFILAVAPYSGAVPGQSLAIELGFLALGVSVCDCLDCFGPPDWAP